MNFMIGPVDIFAAVYVAVAVINGIRRGLSRELGRLAATLAILAAAWGFYPRAGDYLVSRTRLADPGTARVVSFLAILVGGYLLFLLVRLLLKAVMDFKFKGKLERLGGALVGLVRAALLLTLAVIVVSLWPRGALYPHVVENSHVGAFVAAYILPHYEEMAAAHPDWGLPLPSPAEAEALEAPDTGRAPYEEPDAESSSWP